MSRLIERVVGKTRAIYFLATHRTFQAGDKFAYRGKLVVRGPGLVRVGRSVMFDHATGHINRLLTFDPAARLTIGNNCYINGVEIACKQEVSIGDCCILAECLIMDTDFHSVDTNRHDKTAKVRTAPVRIGRNVWLANKVIVIRGVTIGNDSVVGAGSVVTRDVPAGVVVAGNPARIVRHLTDRERCDDQIV